MDIEIRNDKFWEYIPGFIKKNIILPTINTEVIGYFPYHTARLRPYGLHQCVIPRFFVNEFEQLLTLNHINDNKAVYICRSIDNSQFHLHQYHFAINLKDDYIMFGSWEDVVTYDNKPLTHLIKK